jgi:GMP synthase-like glutamine amidotransferase
MRIGILLTGHAPDTLISETGDYDAIFARMLGGHSLTFENFPLVDGQFPDSADAADGWLITGSKHGAYEDHPWIAPLETLIRDIHARKLPLIGICFGHQIIAQALGGTVEKFSGGWAIGRTEYCQDGQSLALNAWHQDQVTRRPAGARVLASNDFCENAILAYDDTIWTVQPHPEFNAHFVDGLIRTRGRGVVPETLLEAATAKLDGSVNNADIATLMVDFFKKERA